MLARGGMAAACCAFTGGRLSQGWPSPMCSARPTRGMASMLARVSAGQGSPNSNPCPQLPQLPRATVVILVRVRTESLVATRTQTTSGSLTSSTRRPSARSASRSCQRPPRRQVARPPSLQCPSMSFATASLRRIFRRWRERRHTRRRIQATCEDMHSKRRFNMMSY